MHCVIVLCLHEMRNSRVVMWSRPVKERATAGTEGKQAPLVLELDLSRKAEEKCVQRILQNKTETTRYTTQKVKEA